MPWSRDDLTRLVDLEAHQQGVDPRLARVVAQQESWFNPNAVGDKGGARGIFQLHKAAAIDAGIDPARRHEVPLNIEGGVRYLKQQLDRFGGDQRLALAAYNAGPGVVTAYGKVPPYKGVQRYVSDAMALLSPSSAEAATPHAQPQASGMSRLQELEAHLARLEGQAAPQAPQAAPAAPPISQTAPTAQTPPEASQEPSAPNTSWTPGMRFQALPSIQQLEPQDRIEKTKLFASLSPELQEEFLQSEQPVAAGLAARGGPAQRPQPVTDPKALLAVGGRPQAPSTNPDQQARVREELAAWEQQAGRPWREGDPRMPSEKKLAVPDEAPVTEGFTKPSTMIPLLMGLGIPGLTVAAPGMAATQAGLSKVLPKAGPLITRGARAIGEGVSQTLGWGAGRTIETGQVPSPGELGTEAALNVAAGGILEGLGATGQAILRRSQAGKAIVASDEATTLARQEFEQATALAKAEQQAGRTEAYQAAERRAREAQVRYQTKVQARDATIAANEQTYQEALAASKAEVQAAQTQRYGQARTETMEEVSAAQARQQQYQQAVTGQEKALTQARAVPGQYQPQTPSWVQYEKFGDAAKDAVVDLTPAKTALAEVRASRGVLPDGTARPLPAAVESIAANLEKATGETSFKTIREELRRLGPLTRSQDGNVRGAAKQLYGIYADVLEASPVANDLLRNANATFRKEMAVQDVAEWLTPGRGIVRIDNQGRETINVGALMTRLEKTVADDSLFRRSFAPDELAALRTDLRRLAGTPTMPRGAMPPAARPELLPGAAPNIPASMTTPTPRAMPPDVPRPRVEMLPGGAGPGRRVAPAGPEPAPTTEREALGERPKVLKDLTRTAMKDYLGTLFGIPGGVVMGANTLWRGGQQLRYGVARTLLSDSARPMMLRALQGGGTVNPRLYGTMVTALSDAERKALLRDTRETRERRR